MGCCSSDNQIESPLKIAGDYRKLLKGQYKQLSELIRFFHSLFLMCVSEMELKSTKKENKLLEILSQKKYCIVTMLKDLRILISQQEYCIGNFCSPKTQEYTYFATENFLTKISNQKIFFNDFYLIKNDENYREMIFNELKDFYVVHIEIEAEIKKKVPFNQSFIKKNSLVKMKYFLDL